MTKLDKIYEALETVMERTVFLAPKMLQMLPWFLLGFVLWAAIAC